MTKIQLLGKVSRLRQELAHALENGGDYGHAKRLMRDLDDGRFNLSQLAEDVALDEAPAIRPRTNTTTIKNIKA